MAPQGSQPQLPGGHRRAALPALHKPTKRELEDLATINALLALDVPPELATQLVKTKFVVAQYRGLFYNRKKFTHGTRRKHRKLDERNRPVFSSAAIAEGSTAWTATTTSTATPYAEPTLRSTSSRSRSRLGAWQRR